MKNNSLRTKNKQSLAELRELLSAWFQKVGIPVNVAKDDAEINEVMTFVEKEYKQTYPNVQFGEKDKYTGNSLNLYSKDGQGNIIASLSLIVDTAEGLPNEQHFAQSITRTRKANQRAMQVGRYVVARPHRKGNWGKVYCELPLLVQFATGFDVVYAILRRSMMNIHVKRYGAVVINEHTGENFGCGEDHAAIAWFLKDTKPSFVKKTANKKVSSAINRTNHMQEEGWNAYAKAFAAMQTHFQREMQLEASEFVNGDVVDCGCGTAKLVPFLSSKENITGYTGIDYSSDMLELANLQIAEFGKPSFTTWSGKIEDFQGKTFDSAVSINSYYSWPAPEKVLRNIFSLLKDNGIFVLVTPNPDIDMVAMVEEAKKELMFHPYWPQFSQTNLALMQDKNANLIAMCDLVRQVTAIGFEVEYCHQKYYLKGLNFLVLRKNAWYKSLIHKAKI